ncbi:MAG: chondroitinase-B domain-containing protein, partial [Burkholderiales bacterium]
MTLSAVGSSLAAPTTNDLQTAIASRTPPALKWRGKTGITISKTKGSEFHRIRGHCHVRRPVVVSAGGRTNVVNCANGKYDARISKSVDELIVTQVLLDGSIAAARLTGTRVGGQRVTPGQLGQALASARPGERLIVEPGTYADAVINLARGGGAPGQPIIIDGTSSVTFTGSTKIQIGVRHVVLRGFTFRDVGIGAVTITARAVRVTESSFLNCGDPQSPQAECVIVRVGGEDTELDFNTFVGSRSMSIKIRAGSNGARDQPVNAFIHHNVFRDIA